MMKQLCQFGLLLILLFSSCTGSKKIDQEENSFIRVKDGQFVLKGEPLYFAGTNFWYGPILGSQGEFGDRERLKRELDLMKANGITNLRVLVGSEGPEGLPSRIVPSLQPTPGVYNETLLDGLDYFMAELGKRDMYAVLYLTNNWDWSGGYAQYLEWSGYGKAPFQAEADWEEFSNYISAMYDCGSCTEQFKKHISFILNRTNFYTKQKYTDDPNIMSWQIANEPRPMAAAQKVKYAQWIHEIAAYIKSLDSNHLVSTGSEGEMGSENDMELYTRVHTDENIDYLTFHIWPKNWSWLDPEDIPSSMDNVLEQTALYMDKHINVARQLRKPIVLEEFGMPRDNHAYNRLDPTTCRDTYYAYIFDWLTRSAAANDVYSGCNNWAWGGYARLSDDHHHWQIGDDYTGDPAQEEQGLNSVFDTDTTTLNIIKQNTALLQRP